MPLLIILLRKKKNPNTRCDVLGFVLIDQLSFLESPGKHCWEDKIFDQINTLCS